VTDVMHETRLTEAVASLRAGGEEAILAAVARVAPELEARAAENDRLGVFPKESIDLLWASGLGSLTIPREDGGIGAELTTVARAIEALAMADAAATLILVWTLLFYRMVNGPESPWPAELRRTMNAAALHGPALGNFLNVEPQLGSSSRGGLVQTRATPVTLQDGSPGWRINGRKIYSTGSNGLQWMVTTAHTEDDPEGLRVGQFLIPGDTPGIEVVETWNHMGMRATASNDVVFTDVDIPLDHGIGLQLYDEGARTSLKPDAAGTLASVIVLVIVIYQGVAKASRDGLLRFLNDRIPANLGAALATLPRFQEAVGEIEALIYANDRLIYDLTRRVDHAAVDHSPPPSLGEVGLVKVLVSRNVLTTTERALALMGNPGLTRDNVLERHHRDALCSRIHTPQDDMVLTNTGKAALAAADSLQTTSQETADE
jgi:alkylation response protein AidB-like acyl-CoA dehydrogenase